MMFSPRDITRFASAKGPWIPIHIWLEDGERDPDTWELLSDQNWKAEWAPRTDTPRLFPIKPFQFINRAFPISKDEFQWLLILEPYLPASDRKGGRHGNEGARNARQRA
jgi:hypothetical protein